MPSIVLSSEKYDGRLALCPHGKKRSEIGIGRNDNPAFLSGAVENFIVVGGLQGVITHMDSVVPRLSQLLREDRRQGIVYTKFHGTVSGSPRSRTASAA